MTKVRVIESTTGNVKASRIIGVLVKNPHGEDLGHILELMLDVQTGQINYAVLDFGGFLGIGNKLFAVPWSAIAVDATDNTLVVNVERATLRAADGFDPDRWPDTNDRIWGEKVHAQYGVRPYWEPRA